MLASSPPPPRGYLQGRGPRGTETQGCGGLSGAECRGIRELWVRGPGKTRSWSRPSAGLTLGAEKPRPAGPPGSQTGTMRSPRGTHSGLRGRGSALVALGREKSPTAASSRLHRATPHGAQALSGPRHRAPRGPRPEGAHPSATPRRPRPQLTPGPPAPRISPAPSRGRWVPPGRGKTWSRARPPQPPPPRSPPSPRRRYTPIPKTG